MIHIGEEIRKKLAEEERSYAWLARRLFMDPSNVSKLLQRSSINTDLLLRISCVLNEDFFEYYSIVYRQMRKND